MFIIGKGTESQIGKTIVGAYPESSETVLCTSSNNGEEILNEFRKIIRGRLLLTGDSKGAKKW